MLDVLFWFCGLIKTVLLNEWGSCFKDTYEDREAGRDSCSLFYTGKPVCPHFTSRDNMTALRSKMKEMLTERSASMLYLFQWKVCHLLGVRGNVMDAWHFPWSCMPPLYVCAHVSHGNRCCPLLACFCCLSHFLFYLSFKASSANNHNPFCSFQRHAKLPNLSEWMVFCAAKAISQLLLLLFFLQGLRSIQKLIWGINEPAPCQDKKKKPS